ncbi:MAG: TRAP transporter substrate-binding protein [Treponema sp.]|nr:TRAP transporter substrate-binding protein [Treponema sp.]
MKKLHVLLPALLILAMLIVVLPGCDKEEGQVFRMADNHPDGYPTVLGNLAFADYVREHTNGRINIQVYNNSVLGQERETIEMTQTGAIHFIRVGINPLTVLNPQLNALGMPFLFRDRAHKFRVLDGPIGDEIRAMLIPQNLYGLCWYDAGFRNFYNSQREIRTPADLQGMRIRVQESALMMDMVRLLGASPTPMAYGEIYTAIQNGIVEGAENNWPSYITAGHYEVASFFTENQHMASPEMILVNTSTWNSFSEEDKAIIYAGAAEGARVEREEWLKAEQEYEATARASGNTITTLTPEERQLFVDALAPLYDQPAYAELADIIQRIRAVE